MVYINKIGTTAALFLCFIFLMPEVNIVKAKGKGEQGGDNSLFLSKEDIEIINNLDLLEAMDLLEDYDVVKESSAMEDDEEEEDDV